MGADFANWQATKDSFELFAYEVMPHFTGQADPVQASYDMVCGAGSRWVDQGWKNRHVPRQGRTSVHFQQKQALFVFVMHIS